MVTIRKQARRALRTLRRIPRRLKLALLVCVAALVAAGVVTAAGGGMPRDAVATVDGESIDESALDRWLTIAAKSGGKPDAQVPEPPDFAACVAAKSKAQAKPAKGRKKPTEAQLKEQCRLEYEDLRDRAMQLLISQRWIEGEARELELAATDSEVRKAFDEQRKRSFPKEAEYRKWLERSGQAEEDILERVRLDLLQTKIRDRMTKGDDKVTEQQIADYFEQNKQRFGEPRRRDLRLILTETEAKAEQAKAALRRGASWRTVAKQFSIDRASRLQGGKLSAVAEGEQEPGLDEAIFRAPKGRLTGPVQTQFGHYVFEVLRLSKGSQQTLAQAKPAIEQLLVAERRQKRLADYAEGFRERWRAKTECRAGYVMQDCRNAPKPIATPGTASR